MERYKYQHYIRVDEGGRIQDGYSTAFREAVEKDICINKEGGYQFRLFPDGEENPNLTGREGVHLYKWSDGSVQETTQEERQEEAEGLPAAEQTFYEGLQEENKLLKAQIRAQSERGDFIEDCIAEMAMQVYKGNGE